MFDRSAGRHRMFRSLLLAATALPFAAAGTAHAQRAVSPQPGDTDTITQLKIATPAPAPATIGGTPPIAASRR